jgi:hypothetical protein
VTNAGQLSVRDVVARLKALEDGARHAVGGVCRRFWPAADAHAAGANPSTKPNYEPTADGGSGHLRQRTANHGSAAAHAVFLQNVKASAPVRAMLWSFSLLMVSQCRWLYVCVLCVHCVAVQCGEYGAASAVSGRLRAAFQATAAIRFLISGMNKSKWERDRVRRRLPTPQTMRTTGC